MTIKFWKGFISVQNMVKEKEAWFDEWLRTAKDAEAENKDLLVFEVPRNPNGTTSFKYLKAIEVFSQTQIKEG
jgi:hypothetical protein